VKNIEADLASRVFNDQTEWKLDPFILSVVYEFLGMPQIDLFASRLNHQLPLYVSWIPDPSAIGVDAFTLKWRNRYNYAFPPFSLIPQVLKKMEEAQAEMLLVSPYWPTQSWFPKLLRLLIHNPVLLLAHQRKLVHLPFNPEKEHPLKNQLQLMACHLSGRVSQTKAYRRELKRSSLNHGDKEHKNNIQSTSKNGKYFAVDGISIPFNQLFLK
jgi:hypothetical protein